MKSIIKLYFHKIESLYNKKVDATGLSIFRKVYFMVLFAEVLQLYYFRHLIFDKVPIIQPAEIDLSIGLIVWMLCIGCLILGLFTRWMSIINYILNLVFISTISSYEYHMFYVYTMVNFLIMFMGVSQVGSLDRLLQKLKYSNTRFNYIPPTKVSVLNYYIVIFAAIGLVYFDSIFYKFASKIWMSGLGMWLPASFPQMIQIDITYLLNQKWIMLILGYLTLGFEAIFIFTFFINRLRIPLLIIGVGLHVGILIFPIPFFALGVIGCYLLMVPFKFWTWLTTLFKFKTTKIVFYYDEECPLCNRTKIILKHLDVLNAIDFKGVQTHASTDAKLQDIPLVSLLENIYSVDTKEKVRAGIDTYIAVFKFIPALFLFSYLMRLPIINQLCKYIYKLVAQNRYVERCNEDNCGYLPPIKPQDSDLIKLTGRFTLGQLKSSIVGVFILLIIFFQFSVIINSKMLYQLKKNLGISEHPIAKDFNQYSEKVETITKPLLGITQHSVFTDYHFEGYNHIVGIEAENLSGEKTWLPITRENGTVGFYTYGPCWAKWGFRTNGTSISNTTLVPGVRDFTLFWMAKNGKMYKPIKFNLWVKKIDNPNGWERDFLKRQMEKPWIKAGQCYWKDETFVWEVKNIEDL